MTQSRFQAVQYFRTEDGQIHHTIEAAEAHQFMLDNAAAIKVKVDAYLNANKLFGRRRAAAENAATAFIAFQMQWNGEPVEFDHEAAEAQAKADAEAAAAEAAKTAAPEAPAEPAAE